MLPLLQLQHLEVKCDACTNASMAELSQLTNLKTLSFYEAGWESSIDILDLRMLPHLQCARLHISCKKLQVAEQCRVQPDLTDTILLDIRDGSHALALVRSVAWTKEAGRRQDQCVAACLPYASTQSELGRPYMHQFLDRLVHR